VLFFGAIDHCTDEIVGWHVAKKGDRWAALEPIRQGVQRHYGSYTPKIALGLGLRHDWGPQYTARQFNGELKWLGIKSSPAFVGEPECNGLIERLMRTLKEECVYGTRFRSLEHARQVLAEFIGRYNQEWILERHGYMTPAEVRESFVQRAA
jgi:putative transposase